MNTTYDIDTLLEEVVSLPSLPGTVAHIMRLVEDPACSLAEVSKAISTDPPLALKTLRLVNTAYYGLRQKITTIEHAVVLLGVKVIRNLVFSATVFDVMKQGMERVFRHSVSCGMATRAVLASCGKGMPVESAEEGFVYGLLHDIGKVILEGFVPSAYESVRERVLTQHVPWYVAERDVIGIDHAQLGGRLAEKWKLPPPFGEVVAGHHELIRCTTPEAKALAAALAIADLICCRAGLTAEDGAIVIVPNDTWTTAGLTSTLVPRVIDEFVESLPAVEDLMRNVA